MAHPGVIRGTESKNLFGTLNRGSILAMFSVPDLPDDRHETSGQMPVTGIPLPLMGIPGRFLGAHDLIAWALLQSIHVSGADVAAGQARVLNRLSGGWPRHFRPDRVAAAPLSLSAQSLGRDNSKDYKLKKQVLVQASTAAKTRRVALLEGTG